MRMWQKDRIHGLVFKGTNNLYKIHESYDNYNRLIYVVCCKKRKFLSFWWPTTFESESKEQVLKIIKKEIQKEADIEFDKLVAILDF